MSTIEHEYLGDGVYASFDGYQVWLTVGNHLNQPVVALEPKVLERLNKYYQRESGQSNEKG